MQNPKREQASTSTLRPYGEALGNGGVAKGPTVTAMA